MDLRLPPDPTDSTLALDYFKLCERGLQVKLHVSNMAAALRTGRLQSLCLQSPGQVYARRGAGSLSRDQPVDLGKALCVSVGFVRL